LYNIQQWTEMPRGGHFAAMEEPDLLLHDIRKFARSLR
jgi:microsomal epoxide hydrolase